MVRKESGMFLGIPIIVDTECNEIVISKELSEFIKNTAGFVEPKGWMIHK